MKCILTFFVIFTLTSIKELHGQCTTPALITFPTSGPKGGTSTITAGWFPECDPSQSGDKILWQKDISGEWITLFEIPQGNSNGFAIDRGNDYDIYGRSMGEGRTSSHQLSITNSEPCDSGTWRVRIINSGISHDSSPNSDLSINETTTTSDIIIEPFDSAILWAGTNIRLTCSVDSVRPNASVTWKIDGKEDTSADDQSSEKPCGGNVWSVHHVNNQMPNEVGSVSVQCILNQGLANQIDSEIASMNVKAPPKIIEEISIDKPEPRADESFTLTCVASGSEVKLSWILNDEPLDMEYFETPVLEDDIRGDLDFGQTTAKKSTLTSIQFKPPTDDSVLKQNGTYRCVATVDMLADDTLKPIQLSYAPLAIGDPNVSLNVEGTTIVECECNVTAFPLPNYTWHQSDEPLTYTTRTIEIEVIKNTNFSCNATNSAGSTEMYFLVTVNPPNDGLSDGAIAGICIGVTACIAAGLALVGYLYKKKEKKKADEEVTAYAESGANNAVNGATARVKTTPVYAEVDKNKKKSPTNTAAPVYSEVNKDKQKRQSAVYSEVNKPGRPLPHLKPKPGSTNTGPVYSEVSKPKQGRLTPIENQSHGGGGGGEYEDIGGKPLPPIKNDRHYDNAGQLKDHGGLHYADVDFLRQGYGGTKQSFGTNNPSFEPTEYAQIDHRKSAGHHV